MIEWDVRDFLPTQSSFQLEVDVDDAEYSEDEEDDEDEALNGLEVVDEEELSENDDLVDEEKRGKDIEEVDYRLRIEMEIIVFKSIRSYWIGAIHSLGEKIRKGFASVSSYF